MTEDFKITDLLDELRDDPSWCQDDALRMNIVDSMIYFIIEN